jgi:hypothetical protein
MRIEKPGDASSALEKGRAMGLSKLVHTSLRITSLLKL